MTDFASVFEQLRQGLGQHWNPGNATNVVLVAIALLVVGVLVGSLGAKFARMGITAAFVAFGAWGGYRFGVAGGFQPAICAAVCGTMVGIISFVTFRLWVGVTTGLVLASLCLGGFGYERILPHAKEFSPAATPMTHVSGATYVVPTTEEQQAYLQRDTGKYLNDLREFVKGRDATVERDGRLIAFATFLTGILLGVLAVRWMAILSTSIVATILVTSASFTLLANAIPSVYQSLTRNPKILAAAMASFLVSSIIVQFMVTRKAATAEK